VYGRALPLALGIKTANPRLRVIVASGDGDAWSAGANHFVHTARQNPNLTYLIMDNGCLGMTKGQPSPTHVARDSAPESAAGCGSALNPVLLSITAGASFVGQGFSWRGTRLGELIQAAIAHEGFAVVNISSPCALFGPAPTAAAPQPEPPRLQSPACVPIPSGHAVNDFQQALALAAGRDSRLLEGVFYRSAAGSGDRARQVAGAGAHGSAPKPLDWFLDLFRV
jgi:hypothetical protein